MRQAAVSSDVRARGAGCSGCVACRAWRRTRCAASPSCCAAGAATFVLPRALPPLCAVLGAYTESADQRGRVRLDGRLGAGRNPQLRSRSAQAACLLLLTLRASCSFVLMRACVPHAPGSAPRHGTRSKKRLRRAHRPSLRKTGARRGCRRPAPPARVRAGAWVAACCRVCARVCGAAAGAHVGWHGHLCLPLPLNLSCPHSPLARTPARGDGGTTTCLLAPPETCFDFTHHSFVH